MKKACNLFFHEETLAVLKDHQARGYESASAMVVAGLEALEREKAHYADLQKLQREVLKNPKFLELLNRDSETLEKSQDAPVFEAHEDADPKNSS